MAVLSVGQAESNYQQAVAGETAANNNYTAALEQKNSAKKDWISSGRAPGTAEAAAYKSASANYDAASVARDEAIANSVNAENDLKDAQGANNSASSQTASDAVADKNANPAPATQNTGTDSSGVGAPLTATEQKQVSAGEIQTPVADLNTSANPGALAPINSQYKVSDDVLQQAAYPAKQVGGNKAVDNVPNNNPLGAYSSYTYGINLHLLTKEDYHTLTSNPISGGWKPSKNLISSANRYVDNRDANFQDDFYFDNLKMSTVIGLNNETRGTNAITVSFTIIEPYGMTLLDRIIDASSSPEIASKNYLDMPYLLEINFFGAGDDGVLGIINNHTKWIPIKFVGFKIKASVKGAEYAIEAIPFNHQAQFESIQSIKTKMEVTAGTVAEYFANTSDPNVVASVDNSRSSQKQTAGELGAGGGRGTARDPRILGNTPPAETVQTPSVKTSSFTAAYNAWNLKEKEDGNTKFADQVYFEIHPDIANSAIVDVNKNDVKKSGETTASTAAQSNNNSSATPTDSVKLSSTVHTINQGTTIKSVINMIVAQSKFILDQVKDTSTENSTADKNTNDPNKTEQKIDPLKLFKIIPKIELGDYDDEKGIWGKIITYYIKKYKVYNNRDDRANKSLPPAAVKNYQYIYTGHNNDVISFDIDFNALYFTAVNVDKGKNSATNISKSTDENKLKSKPSATNNKGQIGTETRLPVSNTFQTSVGGSEKDSKKLTAASVMQGLYTSAAGDMINVKLQILGDPEFIKQDDIFVGPDPSTWNTNDVEEPQYVPGTTSLNMDGGEIFCNLTFKTPRDFDSSTGTYLQSGDKYSVSKFSGYYKVIKVESEFRGGKFTQTLELIRYPNQDNPVDPTSSSEKNDTLRITDEKKLADPRNNPAISKYDVYQVPNSNLSPTLPTTVATDDNVPGLGTTPTNPTTLTEGGEEYQNTNLSNVAQNGETKTLDQATSADGNTVPVQSTNVPEANQQALKDRAYTQIDELSKANAELLAQNRGLQLQNSNLNSDDPAQASQMAQNRAQIAQNKETMLANGNKASEIDSQYKLYQTSVITSKDGTVIKLG